MAELVILGVCFKAQFTDQSVYYKWSSSWPLQHATEQCKPLSSMHLIFLVVCLLLLLLLWKYKEKHHVARCPAIIAIDTLQCYLHLFPATRLRLAWLHNITVCAYIKVLGLDGGDSQMMGSDPFVAGADQITSLCLILLI